MFNVSTLIQGDVVKQTYDNEVHFATLIKVTKFHQGVNESCEKFLLIAKDAFLTVFI